ncbi:hypothetical protein F5880DRAFT_1492959 [Lentinula raphanica]|nr:hypothetical protein F5880DRAFT_1492959 [Lentinula raphanica]
MDDLVERDGVDNDGEEGFVNVLNELTAAERNEWQHKVLPVKSALFKTRKVSFKIIHSTTLLLPRWREQVAGTEFEGQVLPRDVATQWNSTFDMLAAFLRMREPVNEFLDRSSNGLAEYALDDEEWKAIEGLVSVLRLTDESYIYRMAIILHPKHKLKYFNEAEWPQAWIDAAVALTRETWEQTFKPNEQQPLDDDAHVPEVRGPSSFSPPTR